MDIFEVTENKKKFLPLLLLGDEQESMIDRYLERGRMYVLNDGEVRGECVVTDEGEGVLEIRNIAVTPECQGKGYGRALIDFLVERYRGRFGVLRACTGESPLTVPFYECCGFSQVGRVKNYFVDNYDHEIIEDGVRLVDLVRMERAL